MSHGMPMLKFTWIHPSTINHAWQIFREKRCKMPQSQQHQVVIEGAMVILFQGIFENTRNQTHTHTYIYICIFVCTYIYI